jgi:hypothetical protein
MPWSELRIAAPDAAAVDSFHAAALRVGGHDNGPPGFAPDLRPRLLPKRKLSRLPTHNAGRLRPAVQGPFQCDVELVTEMGNLRPICRLGGKPDFEIAVTKNFGRAACCPRHLRAAASAVGGVRSMFAQALWGLVPIADDRL